MTHFRTFTAVVEVDDYSDLRLPGYATEIVRTALEEAGFVGVRIRNEPNENGDMPTHEAKEVAR